METCVSAACCQECFFQHSAHQDNRKFAHKYRLWKHKSINSENGCKLIASALPYLAAPCPYHFLSEMHPCKVTEAGCDLSKQLAFCIFLFFRQMAFAWPVQMANQPVPGVHGRKGLPSERLLPRFLGSVISIYIVCKLKQFLKKRSWYLIPYLTFSADTAKRTGLRELN